MESDHGAEILVVDGFDRVQAEAGGENPVERGRGAAALDMTEDRAAGLFAGALLATAGVVFNRVNVVLFAMNLKGPMPQTAPQSYLPSIFEWGISIGLIAATIFLFGLGARLVPLLPREHAGHG